jgi:hypothetical protein
MEGAGMALPGRAVPQLCRCLVCICMCVCPCASAAPLFVAWAGASQPRPCTQPEDAELPLVTLPGHVSLVNAVTWTADPRRVATCADDAVVRLWTAQPSLDHRESALHVDTAAAFPRPMAPVWNCRPALAASPAQAAATAAAAAVRAQLPPAAGLMGPVAAAGPAVSTAATSTAPAGAFIVPATSLAPPLPVASVLVATGATFSATSASAAAAAPDAAAEAGGSGVAALASSPGPALLSTPGPAAPHRVVLQSPPRRLEVRTRAPRVRDRPLGSGDGAAGGGSGGSSGGGSGAFPGSVGGTSVAPPPAGVAASKPRDIRSFFLRAATV